MPRAGGLHPEGYPWAAGLARSLAKGRGDPEQARPNEHPEMEGLAEAIEGTLGHPEKVVESLSDPEARLYYRFCVGTRVGDKWLCVVVKFVGEDAFVLTAYLTDKTKGGVQLWPRER